MTTLKIGTYNIYEYDRNRRDPAARMRYDQVAEVIRGLDCDVLAVQEICGRGREALEELADKTGMSCWYERPIPFEHVGYVSMVGTNPRPSDFHVALLWNPNTVSARSDGFRAYGGGEFWHGMIMQEFEVDGLGDRRLHVGSYHAAPFAQDARPDEARRVASALTRPSGAERLAIIGADWNSITADRIQDPNGTWRPWHPDPYWSEGSNKWREAYTYQCEIDEADEQGLPTRWHVDRRPGEVLLRAGCRDAAAVAGADWTPTVGHHPQDDMGSRAIDTHRVSSPLVPAVVDWAVVDNDTARAASDHLPVITTLELSRLSSTSASG